MKNLNVKNILTLALALGFLASCNVEQDPTQFAVTVAPQAGDDVAIESKQNEPVRINYSIQQSSDNIKLELKLVQMPLHGVLSNCSQTDLTISCLYTPDKDFVGKDSISFKTQDGDFTSEKSSKLLIFVQADEVEFQADEIASDTEQNNNQEDTPEIHPEILPEVKNDGEVAVSTDETDEVLPEVTQPEENNNEEKVPSDDYTPPVKPAAQYGYIVNVQRISIPSSTSTVCSPLNDANEESSASKGLVGNLRLLNSEHDIKSYRYNLANYLSPTKSFEVPERVLFMNSVNVAPRSFDKGFSTQDNQVLKVNGKTLEEFFNVNLDSVLRVEEDAMAGEYELAIISDDGSRLTVTENKEVGPKMLIKSDAAHAPKFLCADGSSPQYVNFEKNKNIPININYFQGPKYRIALQLLWRKKDNRTTKSSLCGKGLDQGAVQAAADGWQVIPSAVFNTPNSVINTCAISYESLAELTINEPLVEGVEPQNLIKNIKLQIQEGENLVAYEGKIEVSKVEIIADEARYTLKLEEPIARDKSKVLIINYEKTVVNPN